MRKILNFLMDMKIVCLNIKADFELQCPASDACPLYQYCSTGRDHMPAYSTARIDLISAPAILPWNTDQMIEVIEIVKKHNQTTVHPTTPAIRKLGAYHEEKD